jgi:predicted RNA-binding Zn ribbon-like protein
MSASLTVAIPSIAIPDVDLAWLVRLVNGYATSSREASGEDNSHPDVMTDPGAPDLLRAAQPDLVSTAQRLWQVFAGLTTAERTALLNDMLDESELSPRLNKDGELRWTTSFTGSGPRLLAACTAALLSATRQHGWCRMGICAGDDCLDVYFDETGRGARRYCSATCLNRARVRAYRSRQRAGQTS